MVRSNFGAVRLPLLGAAVLASFAVSLSAQVVEKGRTFADLTASHPCNTGLTERIARVTDCDAADDVGDGEGLFQCWVRCDGTAPWETVAIGGGAGGGAATAVTGSATLPATCAEKDLYQDTDSGGTEFYVCTATNTWTKAGTIGGTLGATDNGVCRADGTGGVTAQGSPLSLSDVSGVTTTLATITPAATTGATVAGQALAITASPAVASTDTAGAAAGGSVTITAGAAARNTSGDANGGNINLVTGAEIGAGMPGQVFIPSYGGAVLPMLSFSGDTDTGISNPAANYMDLIAGNGQKLRINATGVRLLSPLYGDGSLVAGLKSTVTASTAGSGAPLALSAVTDIGTVLTNEGSSAANYQALPTAASGLNYTFCVQDADGLRVVANTGDTIRQGASVTSSAGYIVSTTVGSCVTLTAINAAEWFVTSTNDLGTNSWSFN